MALKPELEKATKKGIKKLIHRIWPTAWQIMVVPTGFGVKGIPDHLACAPVVITQDMVGKTFGMFIGIEAKAPGKVPSPTQSIQLAKITCAGGYADFTAGVAQLDKLEQNLRKKYGLQGNLPPPT